MVLQFMDTLLKEQPHCTQQDNHLKIVECLLENDADASRRNRSGLTPLDLAQMKGHKQIKNLLLRIKLMSKQRSKGIDY